MKVFLQDTPQAANIYSWHSIHTHTHTHRTTACLPTYLWAYARGEWGENPGWGHPAAGTHWGAGNGLDSRISFRWSPPGCSPGDRPCTVLSTLAPIQKIIYTHEEYIRVKHVFLCFPGFSSGGAVLLFKSFLFCGWWEWPSLITSMFII